MFRINLLLNLINYFMVENEENITPNKYSTQQKIELIKIFYKGNNYSKTAQIFRNNYSYLNLQTDKNYVRYLIKKF